jgi:hypothetical protein
VLSEQSISWCCIDRLSWQVLSECKVRTRSKILHSEEKYARHRVAFLFLPIIDHGQGWPL